MRVLIIEDEDRLRHMMRLTLESEAEVGEAASGEAGLEAFGNGGWDVVLLDQRLPGIDGLETLRRLRQKDPAVCVVMVTAFASIELAVDAMKLGATDFLRKPVAADALRGAVKAALHMKGERQRTAARPSAAPVAAPSIVSLTMNGYQIIREHEAGASPSRYDYQFTAVQFATGERSRVVVSIDPEEADRVTRLSGRRLEPHSGFWLDQAERFLASYLWTEGTVQDGARLRLDEISRDAIDVAARWQGD
jgi:DNA-binding response OmpR family regulator